MNKFSTNFRWLCLAASLFSCTQVIIAENFSILEPKAVLAANPVTPVAEIPREGNVNYDRYYNSRFNYSVIYPTNILAKQEASQNNDGRTFISPDGKAVMKVFGSHNVFNKDIKNLYRDQLNQPNQKVTYQRLADKWFVVSGYENNRVFYNKTMLHEGDILTLMIHYDKSLQPKFDPIVGAISRSFQASN
jgi:hypothetical protein